MTVSPAFSTGRLFSLPHRPQPPAHELQNDRVPHLCDHREMQLTAQEYFEGVYPQRGSWVGSLAYLAGGGHRDGILERECGSMSDRVTSEF